MSIIEQYKQAGDRMWPGSDYNVNGDAYTDVLKFEVGIGSSPSWCNW